MHITGRHRLKQDSAVLNIASAVPEVHVQTWILASCAGAKRPTLAGDVELRGVTFRYPARPLVPIFEGFSVHAPPGTMLALAGQSGSGK